MNTRVFDNLILTLFIFFLINLIPRSFKISNQQTPLIQNLETERNSKKGVDSSGQYSNFDGKLNDSASVNKINRKIIYTENICSQCGGIFSGED